MNGYVWTDRWVGRYESSVSLDWKLAWANCLQPNDLKVTWVAQKPKPWVSGAEDLKSRRFHEVYADGEHEITGLDSSLSKILLRDLSLRYCRCCLQAGYISIFHQLSDLRLCPIHRCEITKHCRWCGNPTPVRDYHQRARVYKPFHCNHCHRPLANSFDPRAWVSASKTIHPREHRFDSLADWIGRLKHKRWQLRNIERLGGERALPILELMEPLHFDRTLFRIQPQLLSKAVVQHEAEWGSPEPFAWWYSSPKTTHEDKLFYLVVRHIHRRYLKGLKRHLELYQISGLGLDHNAAPVGVHPLVHAYWRWLFFMCSRLHNTLVGPYKRRLWFQAGRNARMMTYWQYMQFTPSSQMHYLLGCYYDFVRLAVGPSTGSRPKAAKTEVIFDDRQLEIRIKEPSEDGWIFENRYEARFCGMPVPDSSGDKKCFFYFYVSRDIVSKTKLLPYSVRSARRVQLNAIATTPELREHHVRRIMKVRLHA